MDSINDMHYGSNPFTFQKAEELREFGLNILRFTNVRNITKHLINTCQNGTDYQVDEVKSCFSFPPFRAGKRKEKQGF